jgi:DNA repair photolyase
MHYKQYKTILSFNNTINLYRGCSMGCIYCDGRSTFYNIGDSFEDIEVKKDSDIILEQELIRKRDKVVIQTGGISDPYIPLEKKLCKTRKALELIDKYEFGVSIVTKSDLVLRDIDLLKSINEKAKSVVNISLSTVDDNIARLVEPGAPLPSRRLETLSILKENNIPTIVWFTPVLPYIEDTEQNIREVVRQCSICKVDGILNYSMGLTLSEGNREFFYKNLDIKFPGVKDKYIKNYGNKNNVISNDNNHLREVFFQECLKEGIESDVTVLNKFMKTLREKEYQQLSLF